MPAPNLFRGSMSNKQTTNNLYSYNKIHIINLRKTLCFAQRFFNILKKKIIFLN